MTREGSAWVNAVERQHRALEQLRQENKRLREALESAHDAINDLVPSGLEWDWWLVERTGNEAHRGLHQLIERALAGQP